MVIFILQVDPYRVDNSNISSPEVPAEQIVREIPGCDEQYPRMYNICMVHMHESNAWVICMSGYTFLYQ